MRFTRFDELPQLLAVFNGLMSLIGPRPEFEWKIPNYPLRHRICSGLSGWAQVNNHYGDT